MKLIDLIQKITMLALMVFVLCGCGDAESNGNSDSGTSIDAGNIEDAASEGGADTGSDSDTDSDTDSDSDAGHDAGYDPYYEWHAFFGSADDDDGRAVAFDDEGYIYVLGQSDGSWTGPFGEQPLNDHNGGLEQDTDYNVFLIKMDQNGTYQWHTFYDGYAQDIVVDSSGNIYVIGLSAAAWTGPSGEQPLNEFQGSEIQFTTFVLKLSANGEYVWHTFYESEANAMVIDDEGSVYITGEAGKTWTGPSGESPLNEPDSHGIYVLKLATDGAYEWHTFYGSESVNMGTGIAINSNGFIYISGFSQRSWNGSGGELPLNEHNNLSGNGFLLKLDSTGEYVWHTFYGLSDLGNYHHEVSLDINDNVYLLGSSWSSWDGPSGEQPLNEFSEDSEDDEPMQVIKPELVLNKLDTDGAYVWHTFYGSSEIDTGYGITITDKGDVYITGSSYATWKGASGESPLHGHSGNENDDIFILKIDSSGSYGWHTFYGYNLAEKYGDIDIAFGVTADGAGNIYTVGNSQNSWNGPTGEGPIYEFDESNWGGRSDIFILKLSE